MAPPQRPQLTLAQSGEPGDGVDRGVLLVESLLLEVFIGTRPSATTVDVAALSRRPGQGEHLLGGEGL
jgi:hypothetical protein